MPSTCYLARFSVFSLVRLVSVSRDEKPIFVLEFQIRLQTRKKFSSFESLIFQQFWLFHAPKNITDNIFCVLPSLRWSSEGNFSLAAKKNTWWDSLIVRYLRENETRLTRTNEKRSRSQTHCQRQSSTAEKNRLLIFSIPEPSTREAY